MRLGRIAGMLIVAGSALSLPAAVLYGRPAAPGDTGQGDFSSLLANACLALLGSGAAGLSVAGPKPLDAPNLRRGLGTLAFGLLSLVVSSIIPIPAGSDALESWPYVIAGGIGLLATATGALVTVFSLARASGPPQSVGRLFLAGVLLVVVTRLLANGAIALGPLRVIPDLLGVFGGVTMILATATLGMLAIRGDRSAPGASAR